MARRRTKRTRRPTRPPVLRRLWRGPTLLAIATVGAVAAVVVLIVLGLLTQDGDKLERMKEISAEGRTRGSPNAPVTIIEFADYQCPFCKRFAETTERRIEEEYIATEQVRLEFRNMAIIGAESVWAAEAAQCANEQGKFWEYHDKLFEKQRAENSGAFSTDRLKRFAGELGLDQAAFDACLDSDKYEQFVLDETEAGRQAGIGSTPSFIINGESLKGARAFEEFQRIIERKLEEAASSP